MDPYQELLAQRARLDAEIKALRATRRKEVLQRIVALMCEFSITAHELEKESAVPGQIGSRRRIVPRYWDPKTGATWSGSGRRPRWMAGRDPEEFRLRPSNEPPYPVSCGEEVAGAKSG